MTRVYSTQYKPDDGLTIIQNQVIEMLRIQGDIDLGCFGGYGAIIDYSSIDGYVIVADTIDGGNEPTLEIYKWAELLEQQKEANQLWQRWVASGFADEYDDTDLFNAWVEVG